MAKLRILLANKYLCLYLVFLIVPSFRAIFKYVPYPLLASLAYVALCCLFFVVICKSDFRTRFVSRIIGWAPLSYLLIATFGVICYFIYPVADSRKEVGKGSTADDALIEPALTLLSDEGLYSPTLYDGAPISPGPGWILANAPFALIDIFWIMSVFYILLTVSLFRGLVKSTKETNVALALLSSSLVFWELLVTGHDIVALGFSFVIFVLLVYALSVGKYHSWVLTFLLAFGVGVFSTSRIVFICFCILLSALLWKFDRMRSATVLIVSLLVAVFLHSYFYLESAFYQPLHLFSRGERQVGLVLSLAGFVATVVAFAIVYRKLENTLESWCASVFVCLSVPLAFISAGELVYSGFDFSLWEGGNYLVPAAPLLLFLIACKFSTLREDDTVSGPWERSAMDLKIRKAAASDLVDVAELFDEYRQSFGQDPDGEITTAFVAERINNADTMMLVGWNDSLEAVGFVHLAPLFSAVYARSGWIVNDLYVRDKVRQAGVGTALMLEAERFARSTDAIGLLLQTQASNHGAQRLFRSLGYVRDDRPYYYLALHER